MKRILLICMILVSASTSWGASCEVGLFDPVHGVLKHERGYQNAKGDTGNCVGKVCGGTKDGITYRDWGAYVKKHYKTSIKNMTLAQEVEIYELNYCSAIRMDALKGQRIPTEFLDLAVNMGTGSAIKIFNKTLKRLQPDSNIKEGTSLSDEAVRVYNSYTQDKDQRSIFYLTLVLVALDRYSDIVESKPTQAKWLLGWIIRLNPYSD